MKKITKYILRAIATFAIALLLSLIHTKITLPINILTLVVSLLFGVPGIALSVFVCSYIF